MSTFTRWRISNLIAMNIQCTGDPISESILTRGVLAIYNHHPRCNRELVDARSQRVLGFITFVAVCSICWDHLGLEDIPVLPSDSRNRTTWNLVRRILADRISYRRLKLSSCQCQEQAKFKRVPGWRTCHRKCQSGSQCQTYSVCTNENLTTGKSYIISK